MQAIIGDQAFPQRSQKRRPIAKRELLLKHRLVDSLDFIFAHPAQRTPGSGALENLNEGIERVHHGPANLSPWDIWR